MAARRLGGSGAAGRRAGLPTVGTRRAPWVSATHGKQRVPGGALPVGQRLRRVGREAGRLRVGLALGGKHGGDLRASAGG